MQVEVKDAGTGRREKPHILSRAVKVQASNRVVRTSGQVDGLVCHSKNKMLLQRVAKQKCLLLNPFTSNFFYLEIKNVKENIKPCVNKRLDEHSQEQGRAKVALYLVIKKQSALSRHQKRKQANSFFLKKHALQQSNS